MRLLASTLIAAALALPALAGCGGSSGSEQVGTTDEAAIDEAAITTVMYENELGGPERCERIYTGHYLKLNWSKTVTAVPGITPLEKCLNDAPPEGVTRDQVKIEVKSVDGDTAVATSKVGAYLPIGLTLVRDPVTGDWEIDDFTD